MKLLADENFPLASVQYLKDIGMDVLHIGDEYKSIKDIEVLNIAIEEGRTILTFDRDFGELIIKDKIKPEKGIIYLRIDSYKPTEPGIVIEDLIKSANLRFEETITVIDKKGIRQRRY